MNEQTLIDMYRAGCVIEANEHLQYSPPSDFCDNLPKVVVVDEFSDFNPDVYDKLKHLQDEGKLAIVCWEQEETLKIKESLENWLEKVDEVIPKIYDIDTITTLEQFEPEPEQLNRKNAKHYKPWYIGGRY